MSIVFGPKITESHAFHSPSHVIARSKATWQSTSPVIARSPQGDVAIHYGLLRCARNDGGLVRTGRTACDVVMDSPVEPRNDKA